MDKFGRFTGVRSLFAVPVVLAMLLAGMALAACGDGGGGGLVPLRLETSV